MEYLIYGGPNIRWDIGKSTSNEVKLTSFHDSYLLNPLKYFDIYLKYGFVGNKNQQFKNHLYIDTYGLIIKVPLGLTLKPEEIVLEISSLLRHLRLTGLQFDLNYGSVNSFFWQKEKLKVGRTKAKISKLSGAYVNIKYHYSRIQWKHLKAADIKKYKNSVIQIYNEILLDAVDARYKNDHRKAILYSCIACETLVSFILDEKYDTLLAKDRLRFKMTVNNKNYIDPIYSLISRTDKFRNKIHEHYLYLFGKSVLMEDKKLYDKLDTLYSTRNTLVHQGDIDLHKTTLLTINETGADSAIQTAIDFFEWTGNTHFKYFRKTDFIHLKE